jgi:hypothetical protein
MTLLAELVAVASVVTACVGPWQLAVALASFSAVILLALL